VSNPLSPEALTELRELEQKATPIASITIHRYEHGGGRLFTEQPRSLVADFYHEADREFYIATRTHMAALLAELDRHQWQPIESYQPLVDPQFVQAWWPHWSNVPVTAFWSSRSNAFVCEAAVSDGPGPTHWMPLPTPPGGSNGQ
jgi:hypothetical protein